VKTPFKVFVFDSKGGPVALQENKIVISRTAASIDAIPASHSIGVEAREKLGGRFVLDYLVHEGDQLPNKGKKTFKTEESLKAGSTGSIKFKLWEGVKSPTRLMTTDLSGCLRLRGLILMRA
jgi:molecular chaperone DnaK